MKIKIFKNHVRDSYDLRDFESDITKWLNYNNDIEIKEFKQSFNDNNELIYTFLYYDKKELRKEKLDKINKL